MSLDSLKSYRGKWLSKLQADATQLVTFYRPHPHCSLSLSEKHFQKWEMHQLKNKMVTIYIACQNSSYWLFLIVSTAF